jgi:hypothetical protein
MKSTLKKCPIASERSNRNEKEKNENGHFLLKVSR